MHARVDFFQCACMEYKYSIIVSSVYVIYTKSKDFKYVSKAKLYSVYFKITYKTQQYT